MCIPIIEETINNHINKIFDAVTRAAGDIRVATIIFMGGGSILLRNYIENMTGLNKEFIDFITDEKANAEGFEMPWSADPQENTGDIVVTFTGKGTIYMRLLKLYGYRPKFRPEQGVNI